MQDTAWGRRVFDQYEIDIEITKHRHSYLNTGQVMVSTVR